VSRPSFAMKVPIVAMVQSPCRFGPPLGHDGAMTGRRPGPAHRFPSQRNEGPKPAAILPREEWPPGGLGNIIAGKVCAGPGRRQSCPRQRPMVAAGDERRLM
jgi:hypothetical protein